MYVHTYVQTQGYGPHGDGIITAVVFLVLLSISSSIVGQYIPMYRHGDMPRMVRA